MLFIYHCHKTLVLTYLHVGRISKLVDKMLCYLCLTSVVWDESQHPVAAVT